MKSWKVRRAEAQKRYERSPKGKAARARYQRSAKGRRTLAASRLAYQRRYRATPRGKAQLRRFYKTTYQQWLKTPAGRRYTERNYLRLPADAPGSLVRSIRLLGALKQEIRNHEYP